MNQGTKRRRITIDHKQITNNQVCDLQYPCSIYKSTQESRGDEDELRIRRRKWNGSELTKDSPHKWTLAF